MASDGFTRKADDEKGRWQMKVGILTLHSQLNYGGVLQCWALQMALERMGHNVVVIDRRLYAEPTMFGGIVPRLNVAGWGRLILRGLLLAGGFAWIKRCRRTRRFLRDRLHLTGYHFHEWANAPKDLGVDAIVVGSDQVWHCGDWGDPRAYLLVGAPNIRAIAYAISFGMTEIPEYINQYERSEKAMSSYVRGLRKFSAVSCREAEGVMICKSLGADAAHVVDPTLLALYDGGGFDRKQCAVKRLVCYLIGEDFYSVWKPLCEFSKKCRCHIEIFTESPLLGISGKGSAVKSLLQRVSRLLEARVRLRLGAGPEEFMHSIEEADWVVSDSFHALMFSIINGCNVRMIKPQSEKRAIMFSRIKEFAGHVKGPMISSSLEIALKSLASGEKVLYDAAWLKSRKVDSEKWLVTALNAAV